MLSCLIAARKNMIGTGFYLGNKIFCDNVQWTQDGHADRLVVKPRSHDTEVQSCGGDVALKYPTPPPDSYKPAPLVTVAWISTRNFWLTVDVGYRGPSQICKDICDVKPSCAAEKPDIEPFKDDYISMSDNLRWLLSLVATPGFQAEKGFFLARNDAGARFKVCHVLFETKGHDDEDENGDDKDAASEAGGSNCGTQDPAQESDGGSKTDYFSIENWPTHSDAASDALEPIKKTHRVIPIPAYDVSGNLTKPDSYCAQLEGALVELYFNLTHWSIAARGTRTTSGTDVYTADIVMIRVLIAPRATPSTSPKKHHLVNLFADPNQPATKRIRYA